MPYIKEDQRPEYDHAINGLPLPQEPGQLNYLLTRIADIYLHSKSGVKGPNYANINEVIGVLDCVKQEFYRRVAAPYEDKKMAENGDVYGL